MSAKRGGGYQEGGGGQQRGGGGGGRGPSHGGGGGCGRGGPPSQQQPPRDGAGGYRYRGGGGRGGGGGARSINTRFLFAPSPDLCAVCGDKANGKNYGATTCHACQAFFQRTVRLHYIYICRFSNSCEVEKEKRNACRSCRYQKCLVEGMRPEAIQNERDPHSSTLRLKRQQSNNNGSTESQQNKLTIQQKTTYANAAAAADRVKNCGDSRKMLDQILELESRLQLIPLPAGASSFAKGTGRNRATEYLANWANSMDPVAKLATGEKITLQHHCSFAFTLLHCVQRSLNASASPLLLLPNDTSLALTSITSSPSNQNQLGPIERGILMQIQAELLLPLRRLDPKRREFAFLKALFLLQSDIFGISAGTNNLLLQCRESLLRAMAPSLDISIRLNQLLLVIPAFYNIGQAISHNPQLAELFGFGFKPLLAAGIPLAAPASQLIGLNSAKDDHKISPRHRSKERETRISRQHNRHDSLSRRSSSHDRDRRGSGRSTDNQSNISRTKTNRSRSPQHRNEAARENDRKDSQISKYGQRNEYPHQKRATHVKFFE